MDQKRNHLLAFFAGFVCLTAIDQWTKGLAVDFLKGKGPLALWDGVALAVFFFVVYTAVKLPARKRYVPMELCLTMIMAGAAGNLIDRVSQGYVVDFLYVKLINFPIFNVADCYVTVGTALLLVLFLWFYTDEEFERLIPGRRERA